jgi:hypothetical protein
MIPTLTALHKLILILFPLVWAMGGAARLGRLFDGRRWR